MEKAGFGVSVVHARVTDVEAGREYVGARTPCVEDGVVGQGGKVGRCGVVVDATCWRKRLHG